MIDFVNLRRRRNDVYDHVAGQIPAVGIDDGIIGHWSKQMPRKSNFPERQTQRDILHDFYRGGFDATSRLREAAMKLRKSVTRRAVTT